MKYNFIFPKRTEFNNVSFIFQYVRCPILSFKKKNQFSLLLLDLIQQDQTEAERERRSEREEHSQHTKFECT